MPLSDAEVDAAVAVAVAEFYGRVAAAVAGGGWDEGFVCPDHGRLCARGPDGGLVISQLGFPDVVVVSTGRLWKPSQLVCERWDAFAGELEGFFGGHGEMLEAC